MYVHNCRHTHVSTGIFSIRLFTCNVLQTLIHQYNSNQHEQFSTTKKQQRRKTANLRDLCVNNKLSVQQKKSYYSYVFATKFFLLCALWYVKYRSRNREKVNVLWVIFSRMQEAAHIIDCVHNEKEIDMLCKWTIQNK